MKAIHWLYAILAVVIIVMAFYRVNLSFLFLDIPVIFIVLILGYLLSFWAHGFNGVAKAYRCAVSGGTRLELEKARVVLSALQRNFIFCASFGVITGIIAVLANIGDLSVVGQAMAATLISALYAVIFCLLLVLPFRASVEAELTEEG